MLVTKKFAWTVCFIQNYSYKFFGTPTSARKKLMPLRKIVDLSHEEKAWKDNIATKQKIDYQKYAFEMNVDVGE